MKKTAPLSKLFSYAETKTVLKDSVFSTKKNSTPLNPIFPPMFSVRFTPPQALSFAPMN